MTEARKGAVGRGDRDPALSSVDGSHHGHFFSFRLRTVREEAFGVACEQQEGNGHSDVVRLSVRGNLRRVECAAGEGHQGPYPKDSRFGESLEKGPGDRKHSEPHG